MIDKIHGVYYLICDICEDESEAIGFLEFDEAVEYKKDNGWQSERDWISDEWIDICPDCQEQ